MTSSDMSTITASGVLALALVTFLGGLGVHVPVAFAACVPLVVGVVLFGLRAYIAYRGADNTSIDEHLEVAAALIESARKAVRK